MNPAGAGENPQLRGTPHAPEPLPAEDGGEASVADEQVTTLSPAVRRAVLDYVEGFYEGDSTKLLRSVAPFVRKVGYYRASPDSAYRGSAMSFPAGFMGYARSVREGREKTPAGAAKEVVLFDVQDQTASAKLTPAPISTSSCWPKLPVDHFR